MDYSIRPYIHNEDPRYVTLFTEIHKLSLIELNKIISDFESVFSGKYGASSFSGEVVFTVEFDKDAAKIVYLGDLIGIEPSIDIYNMLKAYRNRIVEYDQAVSSTKGSN